MTLMIRTPPRPVPTGLDDADGPYEGYKRNIRARFDIIGFDPRGIAAAPR